MKKRSLILPFISLALSLAFLIGSTGITVIIHSCQHCGDFSVNSGLFLSPEMPQDECCEYADNHTEESSNHTFTGDCCHYDIDNVRLSNFAPSELVKISIPDAVPFSFNLSPAEHIINHGIIPVSLHNKHGGRHLKTVYCTIQS